MRKATISFLAGIVLATTGSVYAEDIKSLVGQTKKIQAEVSVKVDGKKADRPGIIIDGTTYLPVRSIGNALDMDVSYSKTEVELTSKGESEMETSTEPKQMTPEDEQNLKTSEEQVLLAKKRIEENRAKVVELENDLKSQEEKLKGETDEFERTIISSSIALIKENIRMANEFTEDQEKAIVSIEAYITKIKAKYQ